jgi:hypothetical protein
MKYWIGLLSFFDYNIRASQQEGTQDQAACRAQRRPSRIAYVNYTGI